MTKQILFSNSKIYAILTIAICLTAISGLLHPASGASLTCPDTAYANQPITCSLNTSGVSNITSCQWTGSEATAWGQTGSGIISNSSCSGANVTYRYPGSVYDGEYGVYDPPSCVTAAIKCNTYGPEQTCASLTRCSAVFLTPPVVTLTCPATLNATEKGTCTTTVSPEISNYVKAYRYVASGAATVTPNGNTVDVIYNQTGAKTVYAMVDIDISKGWNGGQYINGYEVTSNIQVLTPPPITNVTITCPPSLWTGQTGTCTATGTSSLGAVGFSWYSPTATITGNNNSASVKFGQGGQGNVTVTAYLVNDPATKVSQTTQINVNEQQVTAQLNCPTNIYPGQQGACTGSATTEWGTIGYNWTSSGISSGNGNTANVVFQNIGTGTVTMTAYIVEAPDVKATVTKMITVDDPMVNVSLNCPASVWMTQDTSCTASGSALYGNLIYTWSSVKGNIKGSTNNTATVNYSQPGQGDITVTAYLIEAPNVKAVTTTNITVNSPQITAQIDCPQSLWVGATGNCTVNATTDYGTLTYIWTSSGDISSVNENATVVFSQGGTGTVTVEISLAELPDIKLKKIANINVETPQITGDIICPQTLWIGESGNCTISATTDWGTLQYTWSSSGNISGGGSSVNVTFPNVGDGAVSIKASLAEIPTVSVIFNATITVNKPKITAQLTCPSELWKNTSGTCLVNASTTWGNLRYEWTSSGVVIADGNTATVTFSEQGGGSVNVKVYVFEVPDADMTVTSNIYVNGYRKPYVTISGKRFVYVKESGEYSIGNVYSPSGPVDLAWSIDGQDLGAGNSISYTFNEVKKYILTVRSRVQGSGSDPDAESVSTFNVYSSNYPAPKIAIAKPSLVFLNEPATFNVNVYTQSGLNRQLFGRWVLPDGSFEQGDSLTYTFTTLDTKEIRYEAWFEGYEDNVASQATRVTPREYVFPDFNIWSYTGSEGVVPFYAIFKSDGNLQKAVGKTITYNWDFGDGTSYESTRTRYARKEYSQPGLYSVTMKAVDQDGNTDTETFPLNLRLPDPIVLSIKKSFTNRYMKAPLGVFMTARKTGGHPRDSFLTYNWKMNNAEVSSKYAASAKMYDPGNYNLSLDITTKYGYSASASDTVAVNANQKPVCDFTYEDKPAYRVTYFTAKCTDSDGSIVKYNWDFGNGATSGMYRTYARYEAGGSYTVTLTGTDDSGAETTITKTIAIQR
jgi:hypothetical protein